MSTEVVRELFRNFENTLHDRLKVIEDILVTSKSVAGSSDPTLLPRLVALEEHFKSLDDYAMGQVRTLAFNHDQLEERVVSLERSMKSSVEAFQEINATLGMMQARMSKQEEIPVEAAEVQAELEETEEAALNADADAVVTETKAKAAFAKAIEELVEEESEEEELEEEEVEEEEEEELDLEEFEYKKKTYYRDQHNNVYIADEDGCVDPTAVVGIWNPSTKKIDRVSST